MKFIIECSHFDDDASEYGGGRCARINWSTAIVPVDRLHFDEKIVVLHRNVDNSRHTINSYYSIKKHDV